MKNLTNCTPSEFLKQTNRVKKSAEKWLKETDIMNIRKRAAEMEPLSPDLDKDEAKARLGRNIEARDKQVMSNLSAMFDAIFEEHPNETLELLALVCFVEPEDVDSHPINEYLKEISAMMGDESVIGFFTSLARWGVLNTQN